MIITIEEANLTRDLEWFGKMDPFVKIECGDQTFKTSTVEEGGKTPKWVDTKVEFDVKNLEDEVQCAVWEEDPGSNDLVGTAMIKFSALTAGVDKWFELMYEGKSAGQIRLTSKFIDYQKAKETVAASAAAAKQEISKQNDEAHSEEVNKLKTELNDAKSQIKQTEKQLEENKKKQEELNIKAQ